MKTLLALLTMLLLTAPVFAQDDGDIVICPRWIDERCPCIPDVPHTCPVIEGEPPEDIPPDVIIEPQAIPQIRMPAFTGISGLRPR